MLPPGNPENPLVESSENRDAKSPWDKIKLNGNIEKQFLVTTLLSKDIVPFGNLARRMIALPLLFNDDIKLLSSYNQKEIMGTSFSKYLEKAELNWNKHAPIKSRKNMTIYDRIDYQKDLTSQNPFTNLGFLCHLYFIYISCICDSHFYFYSILPES